MTRITRSRRLQAGLAGVSLVSALGAALGFGLTTHTGNAAQAGQAGQGNNGNRATATGSNAREGGERGDDGTRSSTKTGSSNQQHSSPVTQPSPSPPQATTSGS